MAWPLSGWWPLGGKLGSEFMPPLDEGDLLYMPTTFPAISVGKAQDLAIGRTSHKVRNPLNAPRPWAAGVVASNAGRPITGATPEVFDLGDRIGVLRPIGQMAMCETCHGSRDTVEAAIGDVLRASYPDDQAVGFTAGDLRGWFWVEAPLAAR